MIYGYVIGKSWILFINAPKKIIEQNQNIVIFIHSVISCLYESIEICEKNVIYEIKMFFTNI